jgi:hypothetical protein
MDDNGILFKASKMKVVNKQPLETPSEGRYKDTRRVLMGGGGGGGNKRKVGV